MLSLIPKKPKAVFFALLKNKMYGRGYSSYREIELRRSARLTDFSPNSLPNAYGRYIDERIVEYPWLLSRLPRGTGRLLDAGSVLNFEYLLELPTLREKRVFISTLAPEENSSWRSGVSYIFEDLRDTCFRDNYFDWIVSLSTIEHIGLDNTKFYTREDSKRESDPHSWRKAIVEFQRILKPNGRLYLSVPFGRKKNLGWLQIFDSNMTDDIIKAFRPTSHTETHFKYETDGWRESSRDDSCQATYFDYHQENPKNATVAAAGAVVCLELVK